MTTRSIGIRYKPVTLDNYKINYSYGPKGVVTVVIRKADTDQVVFSKKGATEEEAHAALHKIVARQEQKIFMRKYMQDNVYKGHMSVFKENEPDTYSFFFFRRKTRGVARKFQEKININFTSNTEMVEFFLKVFEKLVETYGVSSDTCAFEEEKHSNAKVARPSFSITETFLTPIKEI